MGLASGTYIWLLILLQAPLVLVMSLQVGVTTVSIDRELREIRIRCRALLRGKARRYAFSEVAAVEMEAGTDLDAFVHLRLCTGERVRLSRLGQGMASATADRDAISAALAPQ